MSKVINNFQGRENAIVLKASSSGINSNSIDNPTFAKYIQNMVLNDDNNLAVRNGTAIIAGHEIDVDRIYNHQLKLMNYITSAGISEILIYQTYFVRTPFVKLEQDITIAEVEANKTNIIINIADLEPSNKNILNKYFNDDISIYIEQESYSDKIEIYNVEKNNNTIIFSVNLDISFFDEQFILWVERAGIYKFIDNLPVNNTILLCDDLEPNVIVSYINYQQYLLICNGVDPVLYYDGSVIQELLSDFQIVQNSINKTANNILVLEVALEFEAELRANLVVNSQIKILNRSNVYQENIISESTFEISNVVKITLTLGSELIGEPRNILYKKSLPRFSYINIINDRLFALDSGGSDYKKFRSPDKSMLVYYCSKRRSIFDWYNKAGFIDAINLASNIMDDLQCFNTYQGRILFWGKESVQIWVGTDPTVINDGQNIDFGDFRWVKTEPVGMFSRNMFIELPNIFIFLSKFGIVAVEIDGFNNLIINLQFAENINGYVKKQLENLDKNSDYRALSCFMYPYGNFIGFRFIHNCYIYQIKSGGFWTIFTQNFSESKTFLYDSVSKNLYLSYKNKVLVYCDKINNKNYLDINTTPIPFTIHYNWLNTSANWYNENIHVGCVSADNIVLKVKIYCNFDTSVFNIVDLKVNQINTMYDFDRFDIDEFSNNDLAVYPQETIRFQANSISIKISGVAYKEFVFDSLFLAGGISVN